MNEGLNPHVGPSRREADFGIFSMRWPRYNAVVSRLLVVLIGLVLLTPIVAFVVYVLAGGCRKTPACQVIEGLEFRSIDDGLLLHAACVARCAHHRSFRAATILEERGAASSLADIVRGIRWAISNLQDDELLELALVSLNSIVYSLPDDATVPPAVAAGVVDSLDTAEAALPHGAGARLQGLRERFMELQQLEARVDCYPPQACLSASEDMLLHDDEWMRRAACRRVCVSREGVDPVVALEARKRLSRMSDVNRALERGVVRLSDPLLQASFIARVLRHRSRVLCSKDPAALDRAAEARLLLQEVGPEVRAVYSEEFRAFEEELLSCERQAMFATD